MDRLFLDANILFSAAYHPDAGVARLWRASAAALFTSSFAIEEAHRNLVGEVRLDRLAELLASVVVVATLHVEPRDRGGIVLPEKDWPILGGALSARATHLITGDTRHFGRYYGRRILGILVMPAAGYLAGRS